jgi:hypothetical protein
MPFLVSKLIFAENKYNLNKIKNKIKNNIKNDNKWVATVPEKRQE